jgi:predicted nucleic acid-binding protein
MAGLIYLLDTTTLSDLFTKDYPVQQRIHAAYAAENMLILCQPTYYEVLRGLLKVNATHKLQIFQQDFVRLFHRVALTDSDWEQAARYWADATSRGRQFSDVDLLVAAVATRLDAIIVSSDADFVHCLSIVRTGVLDELASDMPRTIGQDISGCRVIEAIVTVVIALLNDYNYSQCHLDPPSQLYLPHRCLITLLR